MQKVTVEEKVKQIIASRMKDKSKAEALEYDTPLYDSRSWKQG